MKKLLMFAIMGIFATAGSVLGNVNIGDDWTIAQISFMPGTKNWPSKNSINGLKVDLPIGSMDGGLNQKVNGVEFGLISMSHNVTGVQLTLMNIDTENCAGLQMSGASVANDFKGAQVSGYNELRKGSGSQFGVVNVGSENRSFSMGVVNYHEMNSNGVQIGAINSTQNYTGIQIGAFNFNNDEDVNQTGRKKSSAIQFGAINYMKDGFLPIFILVNFKI